MAKVRCKGTVLQQDISSTLTAVAQIISLTLPDMESETTEVDTLDNTLAGIPYACTGRTEGGSVSGELFLDPVLASHKAMLALLETPVETDWNIIFADTGTTEWPFSGAGFGFGGAVALPEALKGTFSIKLTGLPTFPS
jgi:hypothetical protein